MKRLRFACLFVIFISTIVLAQSNGWLQNKFQVD
jgi:hypothetical protein